VVGRAVFFSPELKLTPNCGTIARQGHTPPLSRAGPLTTSPDINNEVSMYSFKMSCAKDGVAALRHLLATVEAANPPWSSRAERSAFETGLNVAMDWAQGRTPQNECLAKLAWPVTGAGRLGHNLALAAAGLRNLIEGDQPAGDLERLEAYARDLERRVLQARATQAFGELLERCERRVVRALAEVDQQAADVSRQINELS